MLSSLLISDVKLSGSVSLGSISSSVYRLGCLGSEASLISVVLLFRIMVISIPFSLAVVRRSRICSDFMFGPVSLY